MALLPSLPFQLILHTNLFSFSFSSNSFCWSLDQFGPHSFSVVLWKVLPLHSCWKAVFSSNYYFTTSCTEEGLFTKLNREEYLLDITAEFIRKKTSYDLIFQRTVWIFPLSHMDNEVYVDVMFHQVSFVILKITDLFWKKKQTINVMNLVMLEHAFIF